MTSPFAHLTGSFSWPTWTPSGAVRFSVVVRTQGHRRNSLVEALRSLEAQTLTPYEVLLMVHRPGQGDQPVVGSGDSAASLIELHDLVSGFDQLPLAIHEVHGGGRARPLNAALDQATGEYVCFLDDDDLAYPNWLAVFDQAIQDHPLTVPRAQTDVQPWATEGRGEPCRPVGPISHPFAPVFDLLAHVSHNETPICSIALPRPVLEHFSLRFDEALPVYEDWDLLMQVAPLAGVTSVEQPTSLYRQLDAANAAEAEPVPIWQATHAKVIDRLSARPLLLPVGDARRIAASHYLPGSGPRDLVADVSQPAVAGSRVRRLVSQFRAIGARTGRRRQ